jgi:hypothetical protein
MSSQLPCNNKRTVHHATTNRLNATWCRLSSAQGQEWLTQTTSLASNIDYTRRRCHRAHHRRHSHLVNTVCSLFCSTQGHQRRELTPTNSRQMCMKRDVMHVPNVSTSRADGSMGYAYNHIRFILILFYFIKYSSVCAYSMHSFQKSELKNINNIFYERLHKGTLTHARPYPPTNYNTHTRFSIPSMIALNHTLYTTQRSMLLSLVLLC